MQHKSVDRNIQKMVEDGQKITPSVRHLAAQLPSYILECTRYEGHHHLWPPNPELNIIKYVQHRYETRVKFNPDQRTLMFYL